MQPMLSLGVRYVHGHVCVVAGELAVRAPCWELCGIALYSIECRRGTYKRYVIRRSHKSHV